jgi:hypothetical protein
MATTTPNFGWSVPESTDLVKDGATAIELLGDSIDTSFVDLLGGTTGQVLTKASGTDLDFSFTTPAAGALALISTTTIGSAVSTVTVSSAFSSTYDNYKITVTGGTCSSSNQFLSLQLGSTTTGYYLANLGAPYDGSPINSNVTNNGSLFNVGITNTNGNNLNAEVFSPNLAKRTYIMNSNPQNASARTGAGYQDSNTVFTAFTIAPGSGTITGGEIRVYGYNN